MGRPLRIKGDNITYHLTSRTNGKRILMKKKSDHKALCRYLAKVLIKHGIICYGFTPMGNHFHVIIKIPDNGADLSQFMCEFKTAYAKYYNNKYNTSGHFWGDRFSSSIIEDERHMLACLRYLDRNPIKAGLTKSPNQWFLTSYPCYAYGKKHPVLPISLHPTYLGLSHDPKRCRKIYLQYVNESENLSDARHSHMTRQSFMAAEDYLKKLINK